MVAAITNEKNEYEVTQSRETPDHTLFPEAIDLSVLASFEEEHVEGEPDLVVELIDLFLEDIPQKLKLMRDALVLEDMVSIRELAHSVKGSSSGLGAYQMATLCSEIESCASDRWLQGVNSFLSRLEQELERVRHAFTTMREARPSTKDSCVGTL